MAAWFSGRGIGLYMMLIVPLTLLFIDTNRKLNIIFVLWGLFSLLATLKGIMQVIIGAVSYTHLDVYKRQGLSGWLPRF